ncbi:hypothetical protein MASSI9I_20709 [Massilia sp. 9I]|nr:hypothetical protein MASSI9I_20709 [Massilia sp. 9I]
MRATQTACHDAFYGPSDNVYDRADNEYGSADKETP